MGGDIVTSAVAGKLLLGNGMYIADSGGALAVFGPTGTVVLQLTTLGIPTKSNNTALVGQGFPLIVKIGAATLSTNTAPALLTYTPPAAAGTYRLSGQLDALTAGTMTFKVIIGYTDPGGNAATDVPGFVLQGGTAITSGGNTANTAGHYVMIPFTFSTDASATAITIGDNSGTYTAGTYYWTPVLERLI